MKTLLFFLSLGLFLEVKAQEDYTIKLNDKTYQIALDKPYQLDVNGKKVTITLKENDTLVYRDTLFDFKYLKGFKVSKIKIDEGIEQITILTAEGSGFLIQRYGNFNPTPLNEMMLTEVTKESIGYGYEAKKSNFKKTLRSGQVIDITKAVLTYKDEVNLYEVASLGKKDEGILIITMMMDENNSEQGRKIIDLLWRTLQFK